MRVLMVGTGSIGRRHMASLRSLVPNVEFDVLRESGRSRETSELGRVDVVGTMDEALARQPQMMVIANPSSLHTCLSLLIKSPMILKYSLLRELSSFLLRASSAWQHSCFNTSSSSTPTISRLNAPSYFTLARIMARLASAYSS